MTVPGFEPPKPLLPFSRVRSRFWASPQTPKAAPCGAAFRSDRGSQTDIEPWIERFTADFCLALPTDFDLVALAALAA